MVDPLAEVVTLLKPQARFSKLVHGASPWRINRSDAGQPFYCAVLDGGCRITIDANPTIELIAGDFVLIPSTQGVVLTSLEAPPAGAETARPVALGNNEFRIGSQELRNPVHAGHDSGLKSDSIPE